MMTEESRIPRGNFIKITTRLLLSLAGLLGLGGLIRFFSISPDCGSQTQFELGRLENLLPGSSMVRMDIPALILYNAGEVEVLSLSCTHLGCTLEEEGNGFSCPCHGSVFDENGRVLAGPADRDLPHLPVEINEEGILIVSTRGVK
jgi:nitrite reductase/ring-hydroxylating ferredoxin subunit